MKKYIFLTLTILSILLFSTTICYAADLDEIVNYEVTVDPRMNDGTLDITYKITWKVLDSKTEGPLTWVMIGLPNNYVDSITKLSSNIRSIQQYNGAYVRIDFTRSYKAGETVTFKYKIHQTNMYKLSGNKCTYNFAPAWFTEAKVQQLTVRWNLDGVKKSNTKYKEGGYLVWQEFGMDHGEKLQLQVVYDKDTFGYLDKNAQMPASHIWLYLTIFAAVLLSMILPIIFMPGYYYGRGFYGGYYGPYGYYGYRHMCVSGFGGFGGFGGGRRRRWRRMCLRLCWKRKSRML